MWSISGKTCGLEDWGLDNIRLGRKALPLHFPYFSHQAATSNYSRVWLGRVPNFYFLEPGFTRALILLMG
ncbi:hypothetical protein CENA302_08905 [Cylindrospermopsis raciborskii CENA302]|uniref:Uncharacterized protein n=1 Tax=Cylindrospermopsis raciborskii CENA302 TaxID=1170768 RepID=A0A9Q5QWY2_9CYAN|nr:hypothetical protein BCV64_00330 [Cylindrospermopsis raciborskii MVCC14]OPH09901.1 hypothetical protein CENA302_08905 [Cylindrospermopsis raciborskii CENA302]